MRSVVAVAVVLVAVLGSGCSCGEPVLPEPPAQCSVVTGVGCLPDEQCTDGVCVPLGRCDGDADCPSSAFRCVFPAQFCELRSGFGEECSDEAGVPCAAGEFCALGRCRIAVDERECGGRLDCPPGQGCDQQHFFCIEEAPCTLADDFPELACEINVETCNTALGACVTECAGQCESDDDCADPLRCNGSCRCVGCLSNDDCGAGLICNIRAGRCQSENLCFTDDDCEAPLICDPRTALCQIAPPPCEDDFDCPIAEICNLENARCELPGGVCIDDRFEDADTPANAETVSIVTDDLAGKLLDDLVLCPGDDDVYLVDLLAGDVLRVVVTERADPELVGFARATVWLLDSNAETSVGFAQTAPRGDGTIVYTAQVDEVVYVRVSAIVAQTFYDLTLTKTRGDTCQPDFFEGAGNDDPLTATAPELAIEGVALSAEICPGDVDYYAIDVAAGEAISARLSFDPSAVDFDVAFVGVDDVVFEQAAGVDEPEVLQQRFLDAQRVFVRVRPFANSTGRYQLVLNREPPFVCADDLEPDDDAPRTIVVPNTSATGLAPAVEERSICGPAALADADRWSINVEDFERLVVTARPADDDLRVILSVENAGGDVLKTSAIGPGPSALGFDATTSGPLFVRATGAFGQVGNYAISLSTENQTDCSPDLLEPNDTVGGRATLVSAGTSTSTAASICESDEDYFAIEGTASKRIIIDLSFLHGDGDLDLMLLGLDGLQILATSDGQVDGERIEAILPLDGTYTIRVFSLTSGAKTQYGLTTEIESP
ncbi:MAG: hypothetical protein Q8O67_19340 [Deltaproteobacteria bacterium]|nr:hypothetical protein [Deltaproteobacteria bacterium]